jgi:hypothetical protein
MQVTVELTKAELAEMQVTESQIKEGVIQALDRGLEIEDDGKLYLAGFNVDVQVVD